MYLVLSWEALYSNNTHKDIIVLYLGLHPILVDSNDNYLQNIMYPFLWEVLHNLCQACMYVQCSIDDTSSFKHWKNS